MTEVIEKPKRGRPPKSSSTGKTPALAGEYSAPYSRSAEPQGSANVESNQVRKSDDAPFIWAEISALNKEIGKLEAAVTNNATLTNSCNTSLSTLLGAVERVEGSLKAQTQQLGEVKTASDGINTRTNNLETDSKATYRIAKIFAWAVPILGTFAVFAVPYFVSNAVIPNIETRVSNKVQANVLKELTHAEANKALQKENADLKARLEKLEKAAISE